MATADSHVVVLGITSLVGLNTQLRLARSSGRDLGVCFGTHIFVFSYFWGLNVLACVLNIILEFQKSPNYLLWNHICIRHAFSVVFMSIFWKYFLAN